MSDVVVVVEGSDTSVTVTETSVNVDVTVIDATVTISDAGPQGSSYPLGGPIYSKVRNATGATLTKGTIVYTSGANGDNVQVTKAQANADATSARTMGFVADNILNGQDGYVIISGYITGIDTDGTTAGQIAYLSPTVAGTWTTTKPKAPNHLVYVGVITRSNKNNGSIFVHPQNGYELDEIHDVLITSPADNQVLTFESTSGLWKNKTNTVDGVQSVVFASPLTGGTVTSSGTVGLDQSALSITRSQVSDFTGGTVAYATSAGSASTAGSATTAGSAVVAASAVYADFANTSGTAVYATNAGTAVSISGSITASQVSGTAVITSDSRLSDSRTPTAHASSHGSAGSDPVTLAQSQVTNLTSDLALKAALTASQTFTGTQTIATGAIGNKGLIVNGASGQTALLADFQVNGSTLASIDSAGLLRTPQILNVASFNNARLQMTNSGALFDVGVATNVVMRVRGAASQSANLTEWQDSNGNILSYIGSSGTFNFSSSGSFMSAVNGRGFFAPTTATTVPMTVRGAVGQSSNLQEWQNSAGTVLAKVASDGTLTATVSAGTTSTAANGTGYMGMPQNAKSASYTITASDAGKHIYVTATGQTITIPANATLALPIGTTFVVVNAAGVSTSIAITTDTLIQAGTGTTGTRTLAANGMATILKITATSWIISGNGLS